MNLPVIESCNNCGACCTGMNSPPFIGREDPEYIALPAEVKASFEAGMRKREEEGWPDMVPCFWLDVETRKCIHYEHRPDICRNGLERNDKGCHKWREDFDLAAAFHLARGSRGTAREMAKTYPDAASAFEHLALNLDRIREILGVHI